MPATRRLDVTLTEDLARLVDEKVASGEFPSASAVVEAGLHHLLSRDAQIERWLREEVAPAYDDAMAHPERLIPIDDLAADIARRRAERAGTAD